MPRRLRFWRPDVRAEVDEELAFHLEMRARDHVDAGLPPAAARLAAERDFGDVGTVRAQCVTIDERRSRRDRRAEYVSDLLNDLRLAARALRRGPAFAVTAVLCVALGVGATTTIFSAVDGILLRPLPYRDADRLVAVYAQNAARDYHGVNVSYPDYVDWRAQNGTFEALGIWTWTSHALSGAGGEAERVEGAAVAANLFPLLGVRPLLGRTFVEAEETLGRDRVALLGHALWQRRYGGDSSIVGRTITIDATPYVVIGVMPPRFAFPDRGALWVPFSTDPKQEAHGNRGYAGAIGRLKRGVSFAQARADLATISARLQRAYPDDNFGWAAEPVPLRQDLVGELRRPLLVLLGAAGLVLLIACANVANLMLARGAARQRELAVRAAIGAGGGRLARQILTECLLLACVGGALGTALAVGGVRLLRDMSPESLPFYLTLALDPTALAFALGASLVTGVAFGGAAALRATGTSLTAALRDGARGAGAGLARNRLRRALVIGEVALSLVLMVGAGLLIRSYRALSGTDLGFQERGALTVRLSLPEAKYTDAGRAARLAFYDALLARVAALPGVTAVGAGQGIPFSGWDTQSELIIEGRPAARKGEALDTHFQWVSPGWFQALGVPLVRGRALAATDRDSSAIPGVINESLARKAFAGADPIGHRVRIGPQEPWVTIVGVVRDFQHYRLPQPMGPAIYFPYATRPVLSQTLVVRTSAADPLALAPAVRAVVRDLDPDVPLWRVQTLAQQVSRSLWRQRMQGQVLGTFAVLALVLAVAGIYGVVSYAVAQRRAEIGVRMAIGASRRQVLALVLGQGARLALAGVAVGLVGALALSRVVASLLYRVDATDPLTFVVVPAALCAVAVLASWVPARRATRVDPTVTMRAE